MKKKIKISIIAVIFLLVVGVFLLNYFGVFKWSNLSLSTIPIDCSDGSLCKNTIPPYTCPPDVDFCQVKGEIGCSSTTSVQRVIFRTNAINSGAYDLDGTWISLSAVPNLVDFIDSSNLIGYCEVSSTGGTTSSNSDLSYFTIHNNQIISWNGIIYIYTNGHYRKYMPCSLSAEKLQDTPLEPYKSNGQEITVGNSPYSCGSTFEILKTDSSLKNSESLVYSASTPGSKQSTQYRLEKGERAEFLGGTYSDSKIYYNTYRITQTCSSDYCESGGIRKCTGGIPGNFTACPYGCVSGKCVDPYQVQMSIKDERGFDRTTFGKNIPVKIYVTITTPQTISGQLTLDLRSGSVQGNSYGTPETVGFTSNTQNIFEFTFPTTDIYYIVLKIDYPQLDEPDIYGTNVGEQKSIEIVDDFSATLRISQTLGNVQNMNKFFTGYPIKVEYIFKEPGDTPVLPDSATVTYKTSAGSEMLLTNPVIQQDDFAGYYIYTLIPTDSGSYTFKGTATKGTFTTIPDIKGAYPIEKDSIVIEYALAYNPVQTGKLYTDILKFKTYNRNKQLIATDNIVKVRINGVDAETVPVKGSDGQYSIDYTFTNTNADYLFIIESNPVAGSPIVKGELLTELINAGTTEDTFCKADSECGFLGVCNSGTCETNITLVITVVLGVIILIVIIIVGIKFFKNRKKEPSFGGGMEYYY